MTKWQPIETAPKDVFVLVCMWYQHDYDGFTITMAICEVDEDKYNGEVVWYAPSPEMKDGTTVPMRYEPTHWMPLPDPPARDE